MRRDHSKYFGPYTDAKAVHDIILLIRKLFQIRNCNRNLPKDIGKERPCLYYQINQCSCPCNSKISEADYRKSIDKAIDFLNGKYTVILDDLKSKMQKQAENLDFEHAAETRDLIENIKKLMDKQRISNPDADDRDIIALARNYSDSVISVFFIRDGNLIGRENHHMTIDPSDTDSLILTEFIKQYYSATPNIPKELLCMVPILEEEILLPFLENKKGQKVFIQTPQKGAKMDLMRLAKDNAKLVLSQDIERIKRHKKRTLGACEEIASILGIPSASRMEAYDISHMSGYNSVASMVVFENGEPLRNGYRKFRLRSSIGNNDYESMKEVLSRRFQDEKLGRFPDVIMMDGGKGQVNVAEMVLDSLGIDIPVCGMVKDDNHRTRALYYQNKETSFQKGSEAMHMITTLQDETHRFAITYHKLLRSKEQIHSILDEIDGIGPKRRKALMMHFKDIEHIKEASIEELSSVDGMIEAAAHSVYFFFHEE